VIRYTLLDRKTAEARRLSVTSGVALPSFLYFSEQTARNAGLEPQPHQFMLALKGLPKGVRPGIAELAERMQIQHHSAVELTNRLAANGYIRRSRKGQDRREVLLALTAKGEKVLRELSPRHRSELRTLGPALVTALKRAMQSTQNADRAASNRGSAKRRKAK
jgi:DNA-binding MarR family transcriptional regulator